MSEISRHPVVAATRALRFADHVTKRNEGSGNENAFSSGRDQSRTQSPQAPWSAVWSPGETLQSRTQSPQAPWSAVWSPGETLGKWNLFNFFDWLFG